MESVDKQKKWLEKNKANIGKVSVILGFFSINIFCLEKYKSLFSLEFWSNT